MERPPKPKFEIDELFAANDFEELFRYQPSDTVQTYNLRQISKGTAELWVRTSSSDGSAARSYLEATFTTLDDAIGLLVEK